jgi:hypothetical protein
MAKKQELESTRLLRAANNVLALRVGVDGIGNVLAEAFKLADNASLPIRRAS